MTENSQAWTEEAKQGFSPSGWVGRTGEVVNSARVRLVAQAFADGLRAEETTAQIAVGYDNRALSREFAENISEVLAGNGLRVLLSQSIVPTAAVALAVRARGLPAGIMLTAGDLPSEYHGLSFIDRFGAPFSPRRLAALVYRLGEEKVKRSGTGIERADFSSAYRRWLESQIDPATLRRAGLRILVDAMGGASDRLLEQIMGSHVARISTIYGLPLASFHGRVPNPEPESLFELVLQVARGKWDLGIAVGGDGGRVAVLDERGEWIPWMYLARLLTEQAAEESRAVSFIRTAETSDRLAVHFRTAKLRQTEIAGGWSVATRSSMNGRADFVFDGSGCFAWPSVLPYRDGLMAAVKVVGFLARRGKSLSELMTEVVGQSGGTSFSRQSVITPDREPAELLSRVVNLLMQNHESREPCLFSSFRFLGRLQEIKLRWPNKQKWALMTRGKAEFEVYLYAEAPTDDVLKALCSQMRDLLSELAAAPRG